MCVFSGSGCTLSGEVSVEVFGVIFEGTGAVTGTGIEGGANLPSGGTCISGWEKLVSPVGGDLYLRLGD